MNNDDPTTNRESIIKTLQYNYYDVNCLLIVSIGIKF